MKLIIGLFVCLLVIIIISQPNLLWMLYRLVGILILARKVDSNKAIIKEQKIIDSILIYAKDFENICIKYKRNNNSICGTFFLLYLKFFSLALGVLYKSKGSYEGLLYTSRGSYEDALPYYKATLAITKKLVGVNKKYYHIIAKYLYELLVLYKLMERYEDAISVCEESLEIRKNTLGIYHVDTAYSLMQLGLLYEKIGRYRDSISIFQQCLENSKNILKIDPLYNVVCLNSLLGIYELMEMYEDALSVSEKFSMNLQKINNYDIKNHERYKKYLDSSSLYLSIERYEDALSELQQSLENHKNTLGINHIDTVFCLNKLGIFYASMQMNEDALSCLEESLKIGIKHFDNRKYLDSLTIFYESIGRNEDAISICQKSLEICENTLGIHHTDTASSLSLLSRLFSNMEKYKYALSYFELSLEIYEDILGINHIYVAACLESLGLVYYCMGRYKDASPLHERSLEIHKNVFGINHSKTVKSLLMLGILLICIGDINTAFQMMLQSSSIQLKLLAQIFKISSEKQRLTHFQKNYYNFEIFISVVYQYFSNSPEAIQAAFELIQRCKLIVTETSILQRNYLSSGRYPHLDTLLKQYQEKIRQIIKLSFQTLTEAEWNYHKQLVEEQQKIEQDLSRQIPELNFEQKLVEIDRRAVALELPEGSTLLEFMRLNIFNILDIKNQTTKSARYLAFILPAGQPDQVQMIDLGEADNIDCLIKVFRENIILGKSDGFDRTILKMKTQEELDKIQANPELNEVFQNKQQLKQLLFDPIQKCLTAGTQKLIIAPDGELNLLPFELLPVNNHQYLMDEYTISYVNVGRDIIRLKFPSTTQPTEPLIIANPDYNLNDENAVICQNTPTKTQRSIDTVYSDLRKSQADGMFTPIPGTGLESVEISRYLGVTPQTEKNALESLVKSQLSPRILHIATHGYFLTIENLKPLKDTPFSQLDSLHRAGMQNVQNPLLRAGLAFAGANTALNGGRLPAAAEDGILTAQDVATFLDLSATKLVVLSACESGLGEVKLGESVHGLRHAFLQTGAKSLIVSLWAVNDISTAILMGQFYHYYLEKKKPVGEALELAKRYVCNLTVGEMRDTWLTDEKIEYVGKYTVESQEKLKELCDKSDDYKPYRHPKYWGAFIYLGLAD